MKLMVISGEISGSVMITDKVNVRLSSSISDGEFLIGSNERVEGIAFNGAKLEFVPTIEHIDRCLVLSSGKICGAGAMQGGVDKEQFLYDYNRVKQVMLNAHKREKELLENDKKSEEKHNIETIKNENKEKENIEERTINLAECTADDMNENEESKNEIIAENSIKIEKKESVIQDFYDKVSDDLQGMFQTYPHNKILENIVYDSDWINVEYGEGKYYVVGVIKEQGTPQIIAYGIPCDDYNKQIEQFKDYEWLPLDKRYPTARGFFLTYQRTIDGSMIRS